MNKRDVRRDILYLVCLKVANEVPLDIFGQHFLLNLQFLHATFAKDALALVVCLLKEWGRVKLETATSSTP